MWPFLFLAAGVAMTTNAGSDNERVVAGAVLSSAFSLLIINATKENK